MNDCSYTFKSIRFFAITAPTASALARQNERLPGMRQGKAAALRQAGGEHPNRNPAAIYLI